MAGATYETVESFKLADGEKISEYVERLNEYFIAKDISNDRKKAAIFLTVFGSETKSLLRQFAVSRGSQQERLCYFNEYPYCSLATKTNVYSRGMQILRTEAGSWRVPLRIYG